MKKFVDIVKKKDLIVVKESDFANDFTDKVESQGVHIVKNDEYSGYSNGAFEAIYSATMDIMDSNGERYDDYFVRPSKERLKEVWSRHTHYQKNKPYDDKLAKKFYYEDCLSEVLTDDEWNFLQWLANKNKFFTYITVTNGWELIDLIEYHPHSSKNKLLEDADYLEKVFFEKWYTLVTEDFAVEQFSLVHDRDLSEYMLNEHSAVEIK